MRCFVALLFVMLVAAASPRSASAQPQTQQVIVPYATCGGTSQTEFCDLVAQLRQQLAAPAPLATPPPAVVATRPPPRCHSGHRGDECRCRARGGLLQEGRCVSARSAITQTSELTRELTTRVTRLETDVADLRTRSTTTDHRVSALDERLTNTAEATNCLQVILLPDVGNTAGTRGTEARAQELVQRYGVHCGSLYRAAYSLPGLATVHVLPPPAATGAHAVPSADEAPITVIFR